jgi:hypothetical protein
MQASIEAFTSASRPALGAAVRPALPAARASPAADLVNLLASAVMHHASKEVFP